MNYEIVDIKRVYKDKSGKICYEFNVLENGKEKNVILEHDSFDCQLNLEIFYDDLKEKRDELNSKLIKNDNISFLFKFAGITSVFFLGAITYFWVLGIIRWPFSVLSKVVFSLLGGDMLGFVFYTYLSSNFDKKLAKKELNKIKNQLNRFYKFQEKCRTLKLENKKQLDRYMNLKDNEISKKNLVQEEKIVALNNPISVLNLQVSPFVEFLISDNNLKEKSLLLNKSKGIVRQYTPDRPNFYQNREKKATMYYSEFLDVPEYLRKKSKL